MNPIQQLANLQQAHDAANTAALASDLAQRLLTSFTFRAAALAHRDAAAACDAVAGPPLPLFAQLQALKDAGLTFPDCIKAFGTTDDPHLQAARAAYQEDGKLEFDEIAVVSLSEDGGAYVMAWRWMDTPESSND